MLRFDGAERVAAALHGVIPQRNGQSDRVTPGAIVAVRSVSPPRPEGGSSTVDQVQDRLP